jgi:hypothetical protein
MSKRLEMIMKENERYEKKTPYNYCDRWCERCSSARQLRCSLYQDELERKLTCIGQGKDPDDPEITRAVMERQFSEAFEGIEETMEEWDIDSDDIEKDVESYSITEQIRKGKENPLAKTAHNYFERTHAFLKETYYGNEALVAALKYDFDTIDWYHCMLPVKVERIIAGFHEQICEGDMSLYDAVAQMQICKKAIALSLRAYASIGTMNNKYVAQTRVLVTLLGNIHSRIKMVEESI